MENVKPFLKWVGGKRQLISNLLSLLPVKFNSYYEPFLGGGALFFALYNKGLIDKVVLSDINEELIVTWKTIKNSASKVIVNLKELIPHNNKKDYYKVRKKDWGKLADDKVATRMIFLNKTGFNGLYRVNKSGGFNVPFGKYKNPKICDEENLRNVSYALQNTEILCTSFEKIAEWVKPKDLIYFDPPYIPVSATSSFTSYTREGFTLDDQERLAETFSLLTDKGVYAILSNSNVEWVRNRYKDFRQIEVGATRRINSCSTKRGKVSELLICGYSN